VIASPQAAWSRRRERRVLASKEPTVFMGPPVSTTLGQSIPDSQDGQVGSSSTAVRKDRQARDGYDPQNLAQTPDRTLTPDYRPDGTRNPPSADLFGLQIPRNGKRQAREGIQSKLLARRAWPGSRRRAVEVNKAIQELGT